MRFLVVFVLLSAAGGLGVALLLHIARQIALGIQPPFLRAIGRVINRFRP